MVLQATIGINYKEGIAVDDVTLSDGLCDEQIDPQSNLQGLLFAFTLSCYSKYSPGDKVILCEARYVFYHVKLCKEKQHHEIHIQLKPPLYWISTDDQGISTNKPIQGNKLPLGVNERVIRWIQNASRKAQTWRLVLDWKQVLLNSVVPHIWLGYLTFSYYFIFDRIVGFYFGDFFNETVMYVITNLNLISVQSWTYLGTDHVTISGLPGTLILNSIMLVVWNLRLKKSPHGI